MSSGFAHFLQRAEGMLCQLHFAKALTPTLCDDGFFSPLFLYKSMGEEKEVHCGRKICLWVQNRNSGARKRKRPECGRFLMVFFVVF